MPMWAHLVVLLVTAGVHAATHHPIILPGDFLQNRINVTLRCPLSVASEALPPGPLFDLAHIIWYKGDRLLTSDDSPDELPLVDRDLLLNDVAHEDLGWYSCRALLRDNSDAFGDTHDSGSLYSVLQHSGSPVLSPIIRSFSIIALASNLATVKPIRISPSYNVFVCDLSEEITSMWIPVVEHFFESVTFEWILHDGANEHSTPSKYLVLSSDYDDSLSCRLSLKIVEQTEYFTMRGASRITDISSHEFKTSEMRNSQSLVGVESSVIRVLCSGEHQDLFNCDQLSPNCPRISTECTSPWVSLVESTHGQFTLHKFTYVEVSITADSIHERAQYRCTVHPGSMEVRILWYFNGRNISHLSVMLEMSDSSVSILRPVNLMVFEAGYIQCVVFSVLGVTLDTVYREPQRSLTMPRPHINGSLKPSVTAAGASDLSSFDPDVHMPAFLLQTSSLPAGLKWLVQWGVFSCEENSLSHPLGGSYEFVKFASYASSALSDPLILSHAGPVYHIKPQLLYRFCVSIYAAGHLEEVGPPVKFTAKTNGLLPWSHVSFAVRPSSNLTGFLVKAQNLKQNDSVRVQCGSSGVTKRLEKSMEIFLPSEILDGFTSCHVHRQEKIPYYDAAVTLNMLPFLLNPEFKVDLYVQYCNENCLLFTWNIPEHARMKFISFELILVPAPSLGHNCRMQPRRVFRLGPPSRAYLARNLSSECLYAAVIHFMDASRNVIASSSYLVTERPGTSIPNQPPGNTLPYAALIADVFKSDSFSGYSGKLRFFSTGSEYSLAWEPCFFPILAFEVVVWSTCSETHYFHLPAWANNLTLDHQPRCRHRASLYSLLTCSEKLLVGTIEEDVESSGGELATEKVNQSDNEIQIMMIGISVLLFSALIPVVMLVLRYSFIVAKLWSSLNKQVASNIPANAALDAMLPSKPTSLSRGRSRGELSDGYAPVSQVMVSPHNNQLILNVPSCDSPGKMCLPQPLPSTHFHVDLGFCDNKSC